MKKTVKLIFCMVLAVVTAFSFAACKKQTSSAPRSDDNGTVYFGEWQSELSGKLSDCYFLDRETNTLSATFADSEETVPYGTHVKLIPPIAIDGKGNCLGVQTKVLSANGDAVSVVSEGFFATDGNGYEIVYTVKLQNGTKRTITQKINVTGSDGMYSDGKLTVDMIAMFSVEKVNLVDLNGKATYDLIDLLSSEEAAVYDEKYSQGRVEWSLISSTGVKQTLDGRSVDFTKTEKANYIVTASLVKFDSKDTFYVGVADFYDGQEELAWASAEGDLAKAELLGATSVSALSLADFPGREGKYYKMESGIDAEKTEEFSFGLMPVHSKEYYEKFGAGKTLKFDLYFSASGAIDRTTLEPMADTPLTMIGAKLDGAPNRMQVKLNTWHTFSLKIEDYQSVWNAFITIEDVMYPDRGWCYAQSCTGYIGNIRIA